MTKVLKNSMISFRLALLKSQSLCALKERKGLYWQAYCVHLLGSHKVLHILKEFLFLQYLGEGDQKCSFWYVKKFVLYLSIFFCFVLRTKNFVSLMLCSSIWMLTYWSLMPTFWPMELFIQITKYVFKKSRRILTCHSFL